MPEAFVDPYIDPETGVLRNLVGARTYDDLQNAEGELVSARTVDYLRAGDLHVDGSLEDFCRIHKSLFRDVYDWSGLPRTIEIRKNVEGSEFFLPSINIPTGFEWAMGGASEGPNACRADTRGRCSSSSPAAVTDSPIAAVAWAHARG